MIVYFLLNLILWQPPAIEIKVAEQWIRFPGKVSISNYDSFLTYPKNHHFIVWEEGRAAGKALITSLVPDTTVQRALEKLGAKGGNNLHKDAWEKRGDKNHPEPRRKVEGTALVIRIQTPDGKWTTPGDWFEPDGSNRFQFRFGGHLHWIPEWQSGCVACLVSCPGGRVSNAAFTFHDDQEGRVKFKIRPEMKKWDGKPVVIEIRLQPETGSL